MTFILAVALWGTKPARADDLDEERAHSLFLAGRVAARAGDDALACAHFTASLELRAAPGTLINLALCEEHLHRFARSYQHFRAFLLAADPDDDRRELANAHASDLSARVARLSLRVAAGFSDARVTLDGEPLTVDPSAAIIVDPGRHEVTFRIGERPTQTAELDLAAGVETTLAVPAVTGEPSRPPNAPLVPAATSATHASLPPAPPPMRGDSSRNIAGWVVTSAGLAALAASAGMGLGILHEKRVVELHCPGGRCDAEGWSAAKTGRALVVAGTAALAIGALAGGSGAYLLFAEGWSARNRSAFIGVGAGF